MITDDRLLFIVGVGRSGTSLLQSMLGAHPNVAVAPETHYLRDYLLDQRRHARTAALAPAAFRERLAQSAAFGRAEVAPTTLVPEGVPLSVRDGFLRLATAYTDRHGTAWFGDKDPNLIDYLPALAAAFPGARVWHIYRDPRDVVLSKTRAAWSAGRPYWQHALIGELQLRRGRRALRKHFGGRCAELAYEDLIADPAATLTRACAAVGLPYDPAMLAYTDTARQLVAENERAWKAETFGPLRRDNTEKWRSDLTAQQVNLIEAVSPTYFGPLGYRPVSDGPAPVARVLRWGLPPARWLYGRLRKNNPG